MANFRKLTNQNLRLKRIAVFLGPCKDLMELQLKGQLPAQDVGEGKIAVEKKNAGNTEERGGTHPV